MDVPGWAGQIRIRRDIDLAGQGTLTGQGQGGGFRDLATGAQEADDAAVSHCVADRLRLASPFGLGWGSGSALGLG